MKYKALFAVIGLAACQGEPPQTNAPKPLLSGSEFITAESRTLQEDAFANPGMIWVERGAALFEDSKTNIACSYCHSDGAQSIDISSSAATHPKLNTRTQSVQSLQSQILTCREDHQDQSRARFSDQDTLALTAYISHLGEEQTIDIDLSHVKMRAAWARGEDYFFTRRGQMNFSCAQCHNDNWGKSLRGDSISQGHPNGFPAYRFEWESLGGLHQRLADCDRGVRAEPHDLGSREYIDLEVYLAARTQGLGLESPAVRR